jgi:glycosyltransferase involved in cell wall biosynthesis
VKNNISRCQKTDRKVTLMVVLYPLEGYGAQFSVLQLLSGLDRSAFDISIAVRRAQGAALPSIPAEIEIIDINAERGISFFKKLAGLLKTRKPDLIWSAMYFNNIITQLAVMLTGKNSRVILSEHMNLTEELKQTGGLRARMFKYLMRLCYPRADAVIAVSRGLAHNVAAELGVPPARISAIYNAVDLAKVCLKSKEDTPKVFWDGVPTFVTVGRLHGQKDYPALIKAVALAKEPLRLLIIGEGYLRNELIELCRELGVEKCVDFLGYQENPYKFMARARALVLSSHFEGFGRVIVEAMACGRPVIATDCAYGPAEIISDGVNGLLVPVDDSAALARAMETLAADSGLAEQMGIAARRRSADFSVGNAAANYTELFLSLSGPL